MNQEVKEVIDELLSTNNGGVYEATGEDGGCILNTLQSFINKPNLSQDLGTYDYVGCSGKGSYRHLLHVYIIEEYKLVILESIDEDPCPGGTCTYAHVQLFLNA